MPVVIKKKQKLSSLPAPDALVDAPVVEGFTRAESEEIARNALRGLVRELAKRHARRDYERLNKEHGP